MQWASFLNRGLLVAVLLPAAQPVHALPKFSRQYGVGCQMCHSVPPRLNYFGQAFLANHFNWPTPRPPNQRRDLAAFPVSGTVETSLEDDRTEKSSTARFRELKLFVAEGFRIERRPGAVYLNPLGASTHEGEGAGDLDDAFVTLPVAGRRGEWSVSAGQYMPILYQWTPHTVLAGSPLALAAPVDAFSFAGHMPGFRVDFYSRRGEGGADGNYLTVGVPFGGKLAFNRRAELEGPLGAFVHAFRRVGWTTFGVFGYAGDGHHLEGVIGTRELRGDLHLLGVLAVGEDADGSTQRLSLEAEYLVGPRLALTGRLEARAGAQADLGPVLGVTGYPFVEPYLRLTAQLVQLEGNRSITLFARGQF